MMIVCVAVTAFASAQTLTWRSHTAYALFWRGPGSIQFAAIELRLRARCL